MRRGEMAAKTGKVSKSKNVKKAVSKLDRKIVTDKDIAMDFAVKVQRKFDRLVKASVLFGSQATAKNNATSGSDIDIILIIDDAAVKWDLELISWYREELGKLITSQNYSRELHINTVKLTT